MLIREIMSRNVKSVPPETRLQEAYQLMQTHVIRHLPVTSSTGELLGLITDRDLKKYISPFAGSNTARDHDQATLEVQVGKLMVKQVYTTNPDAEVKAVLEHLLVKKYGCVPVIEGHQRIVGIVTASNFLRALLKFL